MTPVQETITWCTPISDGLRNLAMGSLGLPGQWVAKIAQLDPGWMCVVAVGYANTDH